MSKNQSLYQYRPVAAEVSNSTAKVIKNFKSENSILSRLWDFATSVPAYVYTQGPELAHGRIETRTCRVYDGLELIADKEKGTTQMMRSISMSFAKPIQFLTQK